MSPMTRHVQVVRPLEACLRQIQRAQALRRSFMAGSTPLPEDNPLLPPLLDAVRLCDQLQIPYALIGGIAAMLYGRRRFTDDVDFVAAGHQETLAANPQMMKACNFAPDSTRKLYHASGIEIDISKDEYTDGIAMRAREVQLGTHTIRVADVHDLIAMKLRAGRLQDDYDIGEIVQGASLDEETLQQLVSSEEFARFQHIRARAAKR